MDAVKTCTECICVYKDIYIYVCVYVFIHIFGPIEMLTDRFEFHADNLLVLNQVEILACFSLC